MHVAPARVEEKATETKRPLAEVGLTQLALSAADSMGARSPGPTAGWSTAHSAMRVCGCDICAWTPNRSE